MAVKKLAISVPEDVIRQVDCAVAERGVTRSRFISDVLRRIANARKDAEITRRVNQLFADPEIAAEQEETAAAFASATPRRGSKW